MVWAVGGGVVIVVVVGCKVVRGDGVEGLLFMVNREDGEGEVVVDIDDDDDDVMGGRICIG